MRTSSSTACPARSFLVAPRQFTQKSHKIVLGGNIEKHAGAKMMRVETIKIRSPAIY